MKFFCSKDCPDLCEFDIILKNGKPYFTPLKRDFDTYPFVCTKLKDFYLMEQNNDLPFYIKNSDRIYCENKEVIRKCAEYLKTVKRKNILFIKGSGSLGYMMQYWDKFMSNFENCYFVEGSPCDATGSAANLEDFGCEINPSHKNLENVETILLFGKNARDISPHFYAYLKYLKRKGKTIFYIDPVKTATAKIASYYVRINPGTDGVLAAGLISQIKKDFSKISLDFVFKETGISRKEFEIILSEIKNAKTGFVIGFGLQRYTNGKNTVQWINRLAIYTNNINNLYFGRSSKSRFEKPLYEINKKIPIPEILGKLEKGFFHLVITVATNPAVTFPAAGKWAKLLKNINSISIDTRHNQTVNSANYFIKVGGMFAQDDVMGSYFFNVESERDKFLKNLSDTEVITMLSKEMGFNINIPSALTVKPTKEIPSRKFSEKSLDIKLPKKENDKFRLITSSHILYLNSQVPEKYKNIDNYVYINPEDAKQNNILNEEKIELIGKNGSFFIKAKISDIVAKGTLLIYKNRESYGIVSNVLTDNIPTDTNTGFAYYDTFINIKKTRQH
jgi:anaerobic selenocysteine-containing dehydrogenase